MKRKKLTIIVLLLILFMTIDVNAASKTGTIKYMSYKQNANLESVLATNFYVSIYKRSDESFLGRELIKEDGYAVFQNLPLKEHYYFVEETDNSAYYKKTFKDLYLDVAGTFYFQARYEYQTINLTANMVKEIYNYSNDSINYSYIPDENTEYSLYREDETLVANFTTDKTGKVNLEQTLAPGKYYFRKTNVDEHYTNEDKEYFEIKCVGDDKTQVYEVPFSVQTNLKKGKLNIHIDNYDERVEKIEIPLYNMEDEYLMTLTTDEFFNITNYLPYGDYYFYKNNSLEKQIITIGETVQELTFTNGEKKEEKEEENEENDTDSSTQDKEENNESDDNGESGKNDEVEDSSSDIENKEDNDTEESNPNTDNFEEPKEEQDKNEVDKSPTEENDSDSSSSKNEETTGEITEEENNKDEVDNSSAEENDSGDLNDENGGNTDGIIDDTNNKDEIADSSTEENDSDNSSDESEETTDGVNDDVNDNEEISDSSNGGNDLDNSSTENEETTNGAIKEEEEQDKIDDSINEENNLDNSFAEIDENNNETTDEEDTSTNEGNNDQVIEEKPPVIENNNLEESKDKEDILEDKNSEQEDEISSTIDDNNLSNLEGNEDKDSLILADDLKEEYTPLEVEIGATDKNVLSFIFYFVALLGLLIIRYA